MKKENKKPIQECTFAELAEEGKRIVQKERLELIRVVQKESLELIRNLRIQGQSECRENFMKNSKKAINDIEEGDYVGGVYKDDFVVFQVKDITTIASGEILYGKSYISYPNDGSFEKLEKVKFSSERSAFSTNRYVSVLGAYPCYGLPERCIARVEDNSPKSIYLLCYGEVQYTFSRSTSGGLDGGVSLLNIPARFNEYLDGTFQEASKNAWKNSTPLSTPTVVLPLPCPKLKLEGIWDYCGEGYRIKWDSVRNSFFAYPISSFSGSMLVETEDLEKDGSFWKQIEYSSSYCAFIDKQSMDKSFGGLEIVKPKKFNNIITPVDPYDLG